MLSLLHHDAILVQIQQIQINSLDDYKFTSNSKIKIKERVKNRLALLRFRQLF
jgi:hypothetical protein